MHLIFVLEQSLYSITPGESDITTGTNHSLTCSSGSAAINGGNITWEFNYGPLPNNVIITSINSTTSLLTIMGATREDNHGRYTCIVQGPGVRSTADAIVYVSGM